VIQRAKSFVKVALVAIYLLALSPAAGVQAHAGLEGSEPKPSSWLATSPNEIVLHFDESVSVTFARIKIIDQEGNEIGEFRPTRDASDPSTVRANIDKLGDGTWVVVWRVASADSHPVQGSFAFSVGTSSSDVTALLNGSLSTRHGLNNLFNVIRFVMFAGVLALIGGIGLITFASHAQLTVRTRMSLWGAWALATFASIEALFAYGPHASGVKVYNFTDLSLLSDTMTTTFGQATLLRISLLLAFVLLLMTLELRAKKLWRFGAIGLSFAIAATLSAVGHPSGESLKALSISLDVMHLLAASLWIGALFLIAIDRSNWLHSSMSMLRFSRVAGYSVGIILVTGSIQTVLLIDDPQNLFATEFGQKLSVKVALVGVLIAIGGLSRKTIRKFGPAKLHQSVLVESLIALLVVGITALIVALPPREQASFAPVEVSLSQSGLIADVTVTPARVGAAEIHFVIGSLQGSFAQMTSVTARMALPGKDIPMGPIDLIRTSPNHYSAVVNFAYAGNWNMEFLVKPLPTKTVLFAFEIKVNE